MNRKEKSPARPDGRQEPPQRTDTEHGQAAVMQPPADCPPWCDREHRDPMGSGDYHHRGSVDLIPLRELPGRDSSFLEVWVSLFHSEELAAEEERVPMVEVHGLDNSGSAGKGLLTAVEARQLAAWLVDAATLVEGQAAG